MQKKYTNDVDHIIFAPGITLKTGKLHEVCGVAKIRFAIFLAAVTKGPIIWIRPSWKKSIFNPNGISHWFSPHRLLLINASYKNDILYSTEESLRSNISQLIIVELDQIPKPISIRRLNIATKNGIDINKNTYPVTLLLTPNKGEITNVESRWHISPLPCWKDSVNSTHGLPNGKWELTRLFSKTEPPAKWSIKAIMNDSKQPQLILKSSKL